MEEKEITDFLKISHKTPSSLVKGRLLEVDAEPGVSTDGD